MLLSEYQNEAKRTLARDLPHAVEGLTLALGLSGETDEALEAAAQCGPQAQLAEVGDCLWYAANLASHFALDLDKLCFSDWRGDYESLEEWQQRFFDSRPDPMRLRLATMRVTEAVKKIYGHGHSKLAADLPRLLRGYLAELATHCNTYNISMTDAAEHNVSKLRARYPNGFETARSVDRSKE